MVIEIWNYLGYGIGNVLAISANPDLNTTTRQRKWKSARRTQVGFRRGVWPGVGALQPQPAGQEVAHGRMETCKANTAYSNTSCAPPLHSGCFWVCWQQARAACCISIHIVHGWWSAQHRNCSAQKKTFAEVLSKSENKIVAGFSMNRAAYTLVTQSRCTTKRATHTHVLKWFGHLLHLKACQHNKWCHI